MTVTGIRERTFSSVLYAAMAAVGAATLYPFLNVLALSLNSASDSVMGGIYLWPREFTLLNYVEVVNYPGLANSLVVSVLRTAFGTVASLLTVSMLSYALSRRDFSARKALTVMFVITMYVSGGMIPVYMVIRMLGLYNNFLVYILPSLVGVFYILLLRTYIESLGPSLQESAQLDGANDIVVFFRIIFPLCAPVLAVVALYTAVNQWNSWFDTYLYTNGKVWKATLQYQLMKILQSTSMVSRVTGNVDSKTAPKVSPESIRMTMTIIATVPILVVYPFLQKYFVKGMMIGAVKS